MLTGPAIRKAIEAGEITIEPYTWSFAGPNSYDVRLASELKTYRLPDCRWPLDSRSDNACDDLLIPESGLILKPNILYLGRTIERLHSNTYAATIHGRSSVGRLGITVHQTAAFIDVGFSGVVTLEIVVVHPVRVHAGMRIAQVAFHPLVGDVELYVGKYQHAVSVEASKLFRDDETKEHEPSHE